MGQFTQFPTMYLKFKEFGTKFVVNFNFIFCSIFTTENNFHHFFHMKSSWFYNSKYVNLESTEIFTVNYSPGI